MKSYPSLVPEQVIRDPDASSAVDETIPESPQSSITFNHRLMAPSPSPQVSGRVKQASM